MSNLMKLKELAKVQNAAALTERIQRSEKARHRRPTAHARARYRCFLPDLAGLARVRRVRPMPDLNDSNKEKRRFPRGGRDPSGARKGVVTFGARKAHESLPFLMGLDEQ